MDMQYLLWLQELREALPEFVEQFFLTISAIAASEALVLVVAVIYWCLDKVLGEKLVLTFSVGSLITNTTKLIACVYRPWILDGRIKPSVDALPQATGYSFPSGHTQSAACLFGATAWYERKKSKVLAAILAAFVILTAISRNFLGAHTPQDVLVGLAVGIASIALTERLISWVDERDGRDRTVFVTTLATLAVLTIFVLVKPYPMHYSESGALLVDPVEMQGDYFKTVGLVAGVVAGWYLERRFVAFECNPKMGWKKIAIRLVVGIAVLVVCYLAAQPFKAPGIDARIYHFAKTFLVLFAASFLSPFAFTKVEQRLNV